MRHEVSTLPDNSGSDHYSYSLVSLIRDPKNTRTVRPSNSSSLSASVLFSRLFYPTSVWPWQITDRLTFSPGTTLGCFSQSFPSQKLPRSTLGLFRAENWDPVTEWCGQSHRTAPARGRVRTQVSNSQFSIFISFLTAPWLHLLFGFAAK